MRTLIGVGLVVVGLGVWFVLSSGDPGDAGDVALVGPAGETVVGDAAPGAAARVADGAVEELAVDVPAADVAADTAVDASRDDVPAPARVVGTVVFDADDTPVAGATVVAHVGRGERRRTARATTDEAGRYAIDVSDGAGLALRGVEVLGGAAWPQRFERQWGPMLALGADVTVDVRVPSAIVASGVVVDLAGAPVVGARVRGLSITPHELADVTPVGDGVTAVSDTSGRFRLEGLGRSFTITGETDDLVSHVVLVSRGDTEFDALDDLRLVLSPARTITGRIVDAVGESVAGARIEAAVDGWMHTPTEIPYEIEGPLPVTATSADDGRFALERVASRDLAVRVETDDHPPWNGRHAPGDGELLVRLATGGAVSGYVYGADGAPIEGADVQYRVASKAKEVTRTDAEGLFAFRGLADADDALIGVRADGHAVAVREPIRVADGASSLPLEIVLEPELRLVGTVVDGDDVPIEGATVSIEGDRVLDQFNQIPPVTWEYLLTDERIETDADGAFAFDNLYAGTFVVTAAHPDDDLLNVQREVSAGSDPLRLVLDPDAISGVTFQGRVTDALTGAPLSDFRVSVMEPKAAGGFSAPIREIADPDGRFTLSGYLPGEKFLSVGAEGYASHQSERADYDVGLHTIDAALLPLRELRLRVIDEDGAPVQGARAEFAVDGRELMVPGNRPFIRTSSIESDAAGLVAARELPATIVDVTVRSADRKSTTDAQFDLTVPHAGVADVVLGDTELVRLTLFVVARGPYAPTEITWPDVPFASREFAEDLVAKFEAGVVQSPDGNSMSVTARRADGRSFHSSTSTFYPSEDAPPGRPDPMMSNVHVPLEPVTITITVGDAERTREWRPGDDEVLLFVL